ncbi:MAG: hypothetical protein K2X87_17265 [Gemmataceae bacterium]|nr:hypothetical protein [Gemmataceae bacterium]
MNARPYPEPDPTPPACGPTVVRLQAVLDGDLPAAALDADPHADGCPTCRGRVRSAKLLLAVYPGRPAAVAVPSGLTDAILAGVRADRHRRTVRRWAGVAAGLAAAAAVVVWSPWKPADRPGVEITERPPTVEPGPVRVAAELAKAGDALKEGSRAWVGPAAAAPKLFAALTETVAAPAVPPPPEVEPVRQSLAELPDAARAGLEPVTGSARKAWDRLLRDVGAVAAKPKS